MGIPLLGTRINGHIYDFSSVAAVVDGISHVNITEISYSQSLDPGTLRGTSAVMTGRTRGTYEADGNLSMYLEDYNQLIAKLAAKGLPFSKGYMEIEFLITVQYGEKLSLPVQDELIGCRIKKDENSHSSGNDPLIIKTDLSVFRLKRNGLDAVAGSAGGAAAAIAGAIGGLIP